MSEVVNINPDDLTLLIQEIDQLDNLPTLLGSECDSKSNYHQPNSNADQMMNNACNTKDSNNSMHDNSIADQLIDIALGDEKTHTESLKCTVCKETFSRKDSLRRHENSKTCQKNKSFSCVKCLKTFTLLHNYKRHLKNFHLVQISKMCKNCGVIDQNALSKHICKKQMKKHPKKKQ